VIQTFRRFRLKSSRSKSGSRDSDFSAIPPQVITLQAGHSNQAEGVNRFAIAVLITLALPGVARASTGQAPLSAHKLFTLLFLMVRPMKNLGRSAACRGAAGPPDTAELQYPHFVLELAK